MGSLDFLRVETIHAVLVHFTIGAVPVLVVAYAMALWRRSARWTFTGDAIVVITAVISLATLTSGLVSNAIVTWPGGLERWRAIHLALGIATASLLVVFAAFRLLATRQQPHAGAYSLAAALVVTVTIVATGWVGGEVLVFHSGMAVKAAGGGTLAPPAVAREDKPSSLPESMGHVRAEWAIIVTSLGLMMAEEPTDDRYQATEEAARILARHAVWLDEVGAPEVEARGQPPDQLRFMAGLLEERANAVKDAAASQDLSELSKSVGELGTSCIGCHETFRWSGSAHEHDEEEEEGGVLSSVRSVIGER